MADKEPSLGEYLKQIRLSKGWSLRRAAQEVGIAHSRVDEVERMIDAHTLKPFVPSYLVLVKFAKAYGLSPEDLLKRGGYELAIELTPEEWKLLGGYRSLSPSGRERVLFCLAEIQEEEGGAQG